MKKQKKHSKRCKFKRHISNRNKSYRVKGNRKYKDSLFCFLFGNEKFKAFTLALYNLVNSTNYNDTSLLSFKTMKDVLYINIKNDVSFLIKSTFNFYEHQSSFNPNMPVRMFIYAAREYDRYIKDNELDVYSSYQLELPVPKFICFYNGEADEPDEKELRFSDSFDGTIKPDIDITVRMLNINYDHNQELLNRCKPLADYALFVHNVRLYMKDKDKDELGNAITSALNSLPDDSEIKKILLSYKSEVFAMCITEYTEEHATRVRKIEADRREKKAREEGHEEAIRNTALNMLAVNIPVEIISQCTGLSLNEITELKESTVNET